MSEDWYWEGSVVSAVCAYLEAHGWTIEHKTNTATREQGGRLLLVEVKGYPSTVYQRGINKGLPKPTRPNVQAKHYYLRSCDKSSNPAHK